MCKSQGRWELHGVTSWGKGCADKSVPGIWASVQEAKTWIRSTMEQHTPGPAPTDAPHAPTNAPGPAPCSDSTSYTDPEYNENCAQWAAYVMTPSDCNGFDFSDELKRACPVACKIGCTPPAARPTPPPTAPPTPPCADSTNYRDPEFQETCAQWAAYVTSPSDCNGFDYSDKLKKACPVACKIGCPTRPPCADSTSYTDPEFKETCAQWAAYTTSASDCKGWDFSDALIKACPVACKVCGAA